MRTSSMLAAAAAAALIATPIAAQAAPVETRTASPVEGESFAGGGIPVWVILLVLALGVGTYLLLHDGEDPVSP